jgi:hypothetical protein
MGCRLYVLGSRGYRNCWVRQKLAQGCSGSSGAHKARKRERLSDAEQSSVYLQRSFVSRMRKFFSCPYPVI